MDELIERASKFLADNPNVNEIELQNGPLRVHLVRFTPIPISYSGFGMPGWSFQPAK